MTRVSPTRVRDSAKPDLSARLPVEAPVPPDRRDDDTLARDMIDVHGPEAATVARDNARAAALAMQLPHAKSWIRILGVIQRQQAGKP